MGSQPEVAKMLGVSTRTLSRRENGKDRIRKEYVLALKKLADDNGTVH